MKTKGNEIEKIYFSYRFVFENGEEKTFEIALDSSSLNIIRGENILNPNWTLRKEFGCEIMECPLKDSDHCHIAVNLQNVIDFFSDIPSYEKVKIYVSSPERDYFKDTSVQHGVGSILGILMVSSGCPVLGKLKPLVRHHLPFASIEETEFRVFSMYLLAQLLKYRKGEKPDWDLDGLKKLYEDIRKINQNVATKIADLEHKDASINAIIVLNNFADSVTFSIDDNDLSQVEYLFKEWL